MKIGITCYPTYGGSGVVATELGLELAARGHDVHFISYAVPVRMTEARERIHFHEVEVVNYPLFDHPPYALALASMMHNVAAAENLDLLHVHYAIPHSVSAYLARAMQIQGRLPFVTTLHGTDITLVGQDRSYLPITRFSIEQSDAVTAISEYLRQVTLKEFEIRRPELRQLRRLLSGGRRFEAGGICAGGRKDSRSPLQFPRRQARFRRGGDLR